MKITDSIREYKNNLNNNFYFKQMLRKEIKYASNIEGFNVLEVGTADGDSSTQALYKVLKKTGNNFNIIGLEPNKNVFDKALSNTKTLSNVTVLNKYFLSQNSIEYFLTKIDDILPIEIDKTGIKKQYLAISYENKFFIEQNYIPNLIFIDSIRYSHLAIIKTLVDFKYHSARLIMEDDIPNGGELKIITKYFKVNNVKNYRCFPHQWPFVAFNISKEIKND